MGISVTGMQALLAAKRGGISFDRTLTIGRQSFNAHPLGLRRLGRAFGLNSEMQRLAASGDDRSFFSLLGSTTIDSLDASEYEGATLVADLNRPLNPMLRERFSIVVDLGCLEHIFDVKSAVENYARVVEVGGHIFLLIPANSMMGHGFYQFSPEFFYRTFSAETGFEVRTVLLCKVHPWAPRYYFAADPTLIGRRVQLRSRSRVYLIGIAKKVRTFDRLSPAPQQADYERAWRKHRRAGSSQSGSADGGGTRGKKKSFLWRALRRPWLELRGQGRWIPKRLNFGQDCFQPLSIHEMARGRLRPGSYRAPISSES